MLGLLFHWAPLADDKWPVSLDQTLEAAVGVGGVGGFNSVKCPVIWTEFKKGTCRRRLREGGKKKNDTQRHSVTRICKKNGPLRWQEPYSPFSLSHLYFVLQNVLYMSFFTMNNIHKNYAAVQVEQAFNYTNIYSALQAEIHPHVCTVQIQRSQSKA